MKALILVAHGSRRQASNDEVITLAREFASEVITEFPIVEVGFLELTQPSIPEAINQAISSGAGDVFIVPYFLAAGTHVHKDIPAEVAKARTQHERVKMQVMPHVGSSALMKTLIYDLLADASAVV